MGDPPQPAIDSSDAVTADAAASAGGVAKRAYVRRIFSEIAPRYDLLNRVLSLGVDGYWRSRAIRELGVARDPTGTYLDLCAGTLDVAAQLGRTVGVGGQVIAADFAEPMLRAGLRKQDPARVVVVVADMLDLPVPDRCIAGAVVAFGLRNVADLDAGLREAQRVLEPGARLVVLDFSMPRAWLVGALYRFYFSRVLPVVGRAVSGHPTAYAYLPKSVATFPTESALAQRMARAGFVDVHWRSLTLGIVAVHVGERAR
jgi:demethylmenaquinone methyltransferase/2-methoxy-6-polyprenyl-1,4-benzoquinol methylase